MPNIDINIKVGNSLISRFALDADLSKALKSIKYSINDYRRYVQEYHHATDKETKRGLLALMEQIKGDFRTEIHRNDPLIKKKSKLAGELYNLTQQGLLFGMTEAEAKKRKAEADKLGQQIEKLDTQIKEIEENRIYENAFEWRFEFPEVLDEEGRFVGFDVVVGNPPYGIITKELVSVYPQSKKFPDSYCQFIVQGYNLLKLGGQFSFIVPNTFCDLESCDDFRKWYLTSLNLFELFQSGWAFEEAIVDTIVFISEKYKAPLNVKVKIILDEEIYFRQVDSFLSNHLFKIDYRNSPGATTLLKKLSSIPVLANFMDVKAGVKLYEKGKGSPPQTSDTLKEKPFTSNVRKEGWMTIYRGGDINRYQLSTPTEFVYYGEWLAAPRNKELFISPKILVRRTDDKIKACVDFDNAICVNSCHVLKYKEEHKGKLSYEYILGIINSKLTQKVFELQNPQMVGKVFSEIKVIYVERLPIKEISMDSLGEMKTFQKITDLVTQILAQKRQDPAAGTSALEAEVDHLVYELYGLTEEEIKIIEG